MYKILPMNVKHIKQVHDIETTCFSIPWSEAAFRDELAKGERAVYAVALDEKTDTPIGYGGMWHIINEGHITNIAVMPEFRRAGVGQQLLDYLLDAAKSLEMIGLTLEVRMGNEPAQKLYTKNGFKPEGIRKNYYESGEDAVIMWKYL